MIIPMMFSGREPRGQQAWTSNGAFVVPPGVHFVAAILIGAGGGGANGSDGDSVESGAGGGGARAYHNALAVTPGETLTIVTSATGGLGGLSKSAGSAGGASQIKRGATVLINAGGGSGGRWTDGANGAGGTASGGEVNQSGQSGSNSGNFRYGGGAGGMPARTGADLYGGQGSLGVGGDGARQDSGRAPSGTGGGVRILWGGNRSFPSNAADV